MHQACSLQSQHAVHAVLCRSMHHTSLQYPSFLTHTGELARHAYIFNHCRCLCMCRFNRLATGPGGTVSIAQVQSLVELGANPFIPRIFQVST